MILKYLIEKEFKQIFRNKFLSKLLFALPIVQLIILPFAANFEMRNINVAVVDEDRSETSRRLTDRVMASGYFNYTGSYDSYPQALVSIEDNSADVVLQFPENMESKLMKEGYAKALIAANAVDGTKGGLGSSYLSSIITDSYANSPIAVSYLYNSHLSYKTFMVPGIIAFLITLICSFVSALHIVEEKERGTIEQINVSPVKKHIFLLSKIIPIWIIGFVVLTLGLLVAYLFYGLVSLGGYFTIYLFTAVYLLFCTGFGLAISAISDTQQQAMLTAFFFLIIFALTSGMFTPINSMPEWAQNMTLANPMRYFVDLLRGVFLRGSGIDAYASHFAMAALFALILNLLAIIGYRKTS